MFHQTGLLFGALPGRKTNNKMQKQRNSFDFAFNKKH